MLNHQLLKRYDIPEIDKKLLEDLNRKQELDLKELREKASKRFEELESMMETKYKNEVSRFFFKLI